METQATTIPPAWLEAADGSSTPLKGTCSLGRSAANEVVLQDDKVSRRHAMINAQGHGEFWLVDLGSSNGTYLNSRRISQPCRLNDGDHIEIATFKFFFRLKSTAVAPEKDRSTEKTIQDIRTLNCWLMVADLEDSTHVLKSLPADQVPRFTGRWLARCKQIVEDHRGTINKFLGDGFFAYWPEQSESAVDVAAAVRSLQRFQAAKDTPRFRFVVHHGKVFLGGEGSLGEESLMGSEVNFIFRMEKVASSLGAAILFSQPARELIRPVLTTTPHGRHPVPSFEGEFEFYTA